MCVLHLAHCPHCWCIWRIETSFLLFGDGSSLTNYHFDLLSLLQDPHLFPGKDHDRLPRDGCGTTKQNLRVVRFHTYFWIACTLLTFSLCLMIPNFSCFDKLSSTILTIALKLCPSKMILPSYHVLQFRMTRFSKKTQSTYNIKMSVSLWNDHQGNLMIQVE
jgi:hypothetical protein